MQSKQQSIIALKCRMVDVPQDASGIHLTLTGRLLYPSDDRVLQFLREGWFEFEELAATARLLRAGDIFVDVGAHCGLYSALAVQRCGSKGTVISVEPNPQNHPFLKANIRPTVTVIDEPVGSGGVTLVNCAVLTSRGHESLFVPGEGLSAYSSIGGEPPLVPSTIEISVATRTLRSLLPTSRGTKTIVFKIDTEGKEADILQQALPSLARNLNAHFLIEFDEDNLRKSGSSTGQLAGLIKSFGYALATFDPQRNLLVPFEGSFPIWGKNLFATRDLVTLNKRLASTPSDIMTMTADFLERGRTSLMLYQRSEQLGRLISYSAKMARRIGSGLDAIEAGELVAPLEQDNNSISLEMSAGEAVGQLIQELDQVQGRLSGVLRYLCKEVAKGRALDARHNHNMAELGDVVSEVDLALARIRARIECKDSDDLGSSDQRAHVIKNVRAGHADAARQLLYSSLERLKQAVEWLLGAYDERGYKLLSQENQIREISNQILAAISDIAGLKADLTRELDPNGSSGNRKPAHAGDEQIEEVLQSLSDEIGRTKALAECYKNRYGASPLKIVSETVTATMQDLAQAQADCVHAIAIFSCVRDGHSRRKPRQKTGGPSNLWQIGELLHASKSSMSSARQRLRPIKALTVVNEASVDQSVMDARELRQQIHNERRLLSSLHEQLRAISLIATRLRHSRWIRLGQTLGAESVIALDSIVRIATTPPGKGKQEDEPI